MTFTVDELATMSGGRIVGDASQRITGAASLAEATAGEITFYADRRYMPQLRKTRASAVFVPPDFSEPIAAVQIQVENPHTAFQKVVLAFAPEPIRFPPGVHRTAVIANDAKLGADVSIQPYAVIEAGVTLGDGSVIGANSYIGHETIIGAGCLIYPQV
ncbi:MAG TPA: LpxD N-terminal domain-containing protein, partial [Chthoniobacterales bacterium]